MDKRSSSTERDICTNFILPAVKQAGWNRMLALVPVDASQLQEAAE